MVRVERLFVTFAAVVLSATGIARPGFAAQANRPRFSPAATAALKAAIVKGDLPAFKKALRSGADVNAWSETGFVGDAGKLPLVIAILHHRTAMVDLLLAHGANPKGNSTTDPNFIPPLGPGGAYIGPLDPEHYMSPLTAAGSEQSIPLTARLLKAGANINATDYSRESVFSFQQPWSNDMASRPTYRYVQFLLEHGFDLRRYPGNQALSYACQTGSPQLISMMLTHGADVNGAPPNGVSYPDNVPIMSAVIGCNVPVVRLLIQRGANVNVRDVSSVSVVSGQNGNVQNNYGGTCLYWVHVGKSGLSRRDPKYKSWLAIEAMLKQSGAVYAEPINPWGWPQTGQIGGLTFDKLGAWASLFPR